MLTDHRHEEILSQLAQTGRVGVTSIAAVLAVSDETIRRDLKMLEERGLLRRIHGGAVLPRLDQERPPVERSGLNSREKGRIAALAEGCVEDGMSLFIDTGTTTLAFARRLTTRKLTVTTNSVDLALLLADSPVRVNLTPGTLRPKDNALVGYDTVDYVRRHVFDLAVMGITACDLAQGWMDYDEHESFLRRALRGQSRRAVLLVDSHKFGRQASLQTFDLAAPLTVVTDRPPPEPFADRFARHDIDLRCT
ncbi:DeoR family transcriptional regulator [Methylorubrum populi]|uniref:DeoR family transcriptional regulator n=1 Tax=Methylobacterium radiotolerans TaxID=31998 RepID=A0ABU7T6B0_9HYPH